MNPCFVVRCLACCFYERSFERATRANGAQQRLTVITHD
jgi:hypothetical protein